MIAQATTNVPPDSFLIDARNRMVDSQVRPNKVSDPRILDAMRQLPRERFLPDALLALAYADQNVPLGSGRVMLQPLALARLVQAAVPVPREKVLVVAAGTGYSAALFAAIGCDVTALEEPGTLLDLAKPVLAAVAPSVKLVGGSLPAGWPAGAPYDIILIDGAVPEVPTTVASQLNRETGRLFTIIPPSTATSGVHRTGLAVQAEPTPAGVSQRALFDFLCPILPGFALAPAFEF
jgi:protein-L-isoaspartate(D-aspartate) O-methyltransferase